MQYVIEIGSNYGFQYTQGSVKYLGWGGESWCMCTKFPEKSDSERILEIGLHLPKYDQKSSVFWGTLCIFTS